MFVDCFGSWLSMFIASPLLSFAGSNTKVLPQNVGTVTICYHFFCIITTLIEQKNIVLLLISTLVHSFLHKENKLWIGIGLPTSFGRIQNYQYVSPLGLWMVAKCFMITSHGFQLVQDYLLAFFSHSELENQMFFSKSSKNHLYMGHFQSLC